MTEIEQKIFELFQLLSEGEKQAFEAMANAMREENQRKAER